MILCEVLGRAHYRNRSLTILAVGKTKFNERRACYGEENSVGDISHHSQDESEEGKKVDLDGLL